MPFASEYDQVYTSGIKPGIEAARLRCERADESARPGFVFGHIEESIREADVIVADLSGLNPNVLVELGMAWGCRKPTVLVSQDRLGAMPFDLRPFRAMEYQVTPPGLDNLSKWLTRSVGEVVQPVPVFELISGQPPVGELVMSLLQIRSLIEPKLAADGYEVLYAGPQDVERSRLSQNWEDVVWPNDRREPCRLRTTEGHTVLRSRIDR